MQKVWIGKILFFACTVAFTAVAVFAQIDDKGYSKSQEVSESDGIPVLIKHLPDWENVRNDAIFIPNKDKLIAIFGEHPIFHSIDFTSGTEAVAAAYPEGKLLIVEYSSPQASSDADSKIKQRLAETAPNPSIFYRRIGNYNVFLFDGTDEAAANALFDQIKYEKVVQWLDKDPTLLQRAERAFIQTYTGIFMGTVIAIVLGIGLSVVTGIAAGLVFYYMREQKRATMTKFSDAGGMTRLNLDDLTPDIASDRLLKD
jgi:hypothetical protein